MLRSFSLDALTDLMNQSISKRIVAILDCCHSGAAKLDRVRVNEDTVSVAANAIDNKSKAIRQREGRCILVASLGPQKRYDLKEEGHGIFTYYLFEGLNGNEDSVDKYRNVTVSSLGNFVYDAIVNLSEEKRPKQKPLTKTEGDGSIILAQYSSLAKLTVHYRS